MDNSDKLKVKIFGDKTLESLFEDIYSNSCERKQDISKVVGMIVDKYIKSGQDASVFMPIIKDYLDVGVKNDEQLVKMAAVTQRLLANDASDGAGQLLSEKEKEELLRMSKDTKQQYDLLAKELDSKLPKSEG